MRVTNTMVFNASLAHLQQQQGRLFRAREEAVSGKKILHPSDDPVSTRRILYLRDNLSNLDQFGRNRLSVSGSLNVTETSLGDLEEVLHRAQELAIQGADDALLPEDRKTLGREVAQLFGQVIQLGNTEFEGQYLFAGRTNDQPPLSPTGEFSGDSGDIRLEVAPQQTLAMNIPGTRFLASDVRPDIDLNTTLASLGIGTPGTIAITDRSGNTANVNLAAAVTIGDVITTITGTAGISVTAAINADSNGLVLTDTNPTPTGNLTVAEIGGGTTASQLGIAMDRPGSITGSPLKPLLTPATPLSLLYAGQGITAGTVHIANGATETDVDLSTATTIGDALALLNASGTNVTASINTAGTALEVRSNDTTTVAVVTDVNGGTTAESLGIQGRQDTLKTLSLLQEALEQNDRQAIGNLLSHIHAGLDRVLELRGEVGARLRRNELVTQGHEDLTLTLTTFRSQLEDVDAATAFTRLLDLSTAFEAALATTARMVQPSLLDFLR